MKNKHDNIFNANPGPILVLAGPGTGKTHSLARRVKWLVEECAVPPDEITVITFTTEAALNMRHRLSDEEKPDVYMTRDKQPSQISTMHSLGLKIILSNANVLGLTEDFNLVDSDVLRLLLFGDAAQLIGNDRAQGIEAATYKQHGLIPSKDHTLRPITDMYNSILRACDAIDFDDQILIACDLLRTTPSLLAEYQNRAKHLLVDEYQDINDTQFQLIKLLSGSTSNGLFAVGDDDQSVYSFRGGSPQYVRHFKDHFGDSAKILPISLCRRCPPIILRGALNVVERYNPERLYKADPDFLSTVNSTICLLNCPTEEKEAQIIAAKCASVTPSHDVLILVPQLSFAKPILKSLRKNRVAYDSRAVVFEAGLTILDTLGDWLEDNNANFSLRLSIQNLIGTDNFSVPSNRVRKPEKIAERNVYLTEISLLWQDVITNKCTLFESLKKNAKNSTFLNDLLKAAEDLAVSYDSSTTKFLETIGRVMQPWNKPSDIFQEISMWIDDLKGHGTAGQASVRVMSMRLAKGLEADYVFVTGLDENIFPKSDLSENKLAECSRLMFVSMTRARSELILCHSRTRSAATTHIANPYGLKKSQFIDAISKEFIREQYIKGESK